MRTKYKKPNNIYRWSKTKDNLLMKWGGEEIDLKETSLQKMAKKWELEVEGTVFGQEERDMNCSCGKKTGK